MDKSKRTGVWRFDGWGRVSSRAILASIGLHSLVLVGLGVLHPRFEPSSATSPGIVLAEFVLFEDADGDGGRVQNAEAVADEPEPMAGHADDPLESRLPVEPGVENELPNAREAAEGLLAQTGAEGTPTFEPPQPQKPPRFSEPQWSHEPPHSEKLTQRFELMPSLREANLVASVPAPLPDFRSFREPEIAALQAGEREMLDELLAEWSTDADATTAEQLSWEHEGRAYSARVRHDAASDNMGMDRMIVEVTTERDGRRWSTQMRMQRLAFSSFTQFVDRWDPSVQIHDDVIDGRFHSNSQINISRSGGVQPLFHGKVTTAQRVDTSNSERFVRREEVFLGGLETRVRRIDLPRQFASLDNIGNIAPERVHRLVADAEIAFHADGSFSWAHLKGDMSRHRIRLSDEPHYLLGDKGVSLRVRGVVNGKVLVYAPRDVVIGDDLIYAADPRLDPDSDDFIGLIADRYVTIAESRLTGPGDVTVHAAILAKRRFLVRNYNSRRAGTLHVYGSVAAGSLSATEPRFRTRLEFDPRLGDARPPGFPVTDRYEVVEWDETWTEELPGGTG